MAFRGTSVIRNFATSAMANQMIKPPIQVFGLEGRYAMALYSAATKQKQLENVEKDLLKISSTLDTDKKFREFILNPIIKRSLKGEALKSVASKLSCASSSANLLAMLAENGRMKNLRSIINAFKTIMSAHRGDLPCEVVSAKPLDEATKQELQSVLNKFAKKGEHVLISYKMDPSLVGGLIVSIGDKYVDMSIASKIKKYSDILTSSV